MEARVGLRVGGVTGDTVERNKKYLADGGKKKEKKWGFKGFWRPRIRKVLNLCLGKPKGLDKKFWGSLLRHEIQSRAFTARQHVMTRLGEKKGGRKIFSHIFKIHLDALGRGTRNMSNWKTEDTIWRGMSKRLKYVRVWNICFLGGGGAPKIASIGDWGGGAYLGPVKNSIKKIQEAI